MVDQPLYQKLIDFWKTNPSDEQIYEKIIGILRSLCGNRMAACEAFYECQFSKSEMIQYNAESFKDWMPIIDKWQKALATGAILPSGDRGGKVDDKGQFGQRESKRYTKRIENMPEYLAIAPECDFIFLQNEITPDYQEEYDKVELKPVPRLPSDEADYAYSVISFAFYQLLQKYKNATLFHYLCSSCNQAFYSTKNKVKYCSDKCRTDDKIRPRRIPGIEENISERDYQAWRKDCRGLTEEPSETWNRAWYKNRKNTR